MYFLKKVVQFQNVCTEVLQLVMDTTESRKCVCVPANRNRVRDASFQVF